MTLHRGQDRQVTLPPVPPHPTLPSPSPCPGTPPKTAMLATRVLIVCWLVLLPGSVGQALVWQSPSTGSNGIPPVLQMPYSTFCDTSVGSMLVQPMLRNSGMSPRCVGTVVLSKLEMNHLLTLLAFSSQNQFWALSPIAL